MNKKEIARYIDHTNLLPTASKEDIAQLCEEANKNAFYSVCVNPKYVEFAKECINELNSKIKVCTVVGYPLGENTQEIKAMEAVMAKESGADELNVVVSTSAIITANYEYVLEEVKRIVDCTEIPVRAILETNKLTEEQVIKACEVCVEAGVKYVATSTGVLGSNVTPETVKLISDAVAGICEVVAIGEIDNLESFYDMVCAGATRVGTSHGLKILEEFEKNKK